MEEGIGYLIMRINKESKWAKSSDFKKRINGFFVYTFSALISLISPLLADTVMYKTLKEQFIDEDDDDRIL